jgi:UDP-MurNAc hydroxylase
MKIQFATNASFLIELESGLRILTDPWYSGGIYYGSWYNYPPLSAAQKQHFLASKPDLIYISHIHPDHLDAATLPEFDKSTPIIIGKLPLPHLLRSIRRLGFTDIREQPFGELVRESGIELCVLPEFEGTGDGTPDDVDYALDTSLYLKDRDGVSLLHVVDNPIKVSDASSLRERFGDIDVAILPYSGASFFPHAFSALTDEEKASRTEQLRSARLQALVEIANTLQPRWVIPAAGSYVMGGRISGDSKFLHQATPSQLHEFWRNSAHNPDALQTLSPGDTFNYPAGTVTRHADRTYEDFSEADRTSYASTLSTYPLAQDEVAIPSQFVLPWRRLLDKARKNLWSSQQRQNLMPAVDVELEINPVPGCPVQDGSGRYFRFALDREKPYAPNESVAGGEDRLFVRFRIDSSLMLMLLAGGAVWNNVEIGALVECEREPDVYVPTVHSLMSFFML